MKTFGIDLGTTNCALAWAQTKAEEESVVSGIFAIAQLVDSGLVEAQSTLPSFIYLPAAHESSTLNLSLPWDEVNMVAVGLMGRKEGSKKPDRLVSSAKSWLSQEGVDRNKPILPWKGASDLTALSPVQASTEYLKHLCASWRFANPAEPLSEAQVVLTVPASFDAVARELTAEAARAAGLAKVTLLEEPQAAFYAWLEECGEDWRQQVKKGDLVLVCDVGGGTTDFSLIEVHEQAGELELERIAVGQHILLGGDNMDLAIAAVVRQRLKLEGTKLDAWQFQVLTYGCREAKESLLQEGGASEFSLTIPGRGSSLVGGSLQVTVKRAEVEAALYEGFFPRVELGTAPLSKRRIGLTELGLPYESDPAITRHLSAFLADRRPTTILFNGGVFRASGIKTRLQHIMSDWFGGPVRELMGADLGLAVAKGAARYGLVKEGHGIRIRGGLARAYYIGVELAMPAIPGLEPPIKAVCVAPFGMEEGTTLQVPEQEFGLVVGEAVEFPFLGSLGKADDQVGQVHEDWEDLGIEQLAAVGATLQSEEDDGKAERPVAVRLETTATEIGTLELYCLERDGPGRWKLEFNVRHDEE